MSKYTEKQNILVLLLSSFVVATDINLSSNLNCRAANTFHSLRTHILNPLDSSEYSIPLLLVLIVARTYPCLQFC